MSTKKNDAPKSLDATKREIDAQTALITEHEATLAAERKKLRDLEREFWRLAGPKLAEAAPREAVPTKEWLLHFLRDQQRPSTEPQPPIVTFHDSASIRLYPSVVPFNMAAMDAENQR